MNDHRRSACVDRSLSRPDLRCVLVVPWIGLQPNTGGLQRSRTFFEAAQRLGPTKILAIGNMDEAHLARLFPEAEEIRVASQKTIAPDRRGWMKRRWYGLKKVIDFGGSYGADPAFGDLIKEVASPQPGEKTILIFRYAHTFCLSGLLADEMPDIVVCVDADDREDQKYSVKMENLIGTALARRIFLPLLIPRFSKMLLDRLNKASHVWFAAEEDLVDLDSTSTSVIPNISRQVPLETLPEPSRAGPQVLFVGVFGHDPNRLGVQWFLEQCWPRIRSTCPDAEFRIVGRGAWSSLSRSRFDLTGVTIVGEVENLDAEYAAARLVVCPMPLGSGSTVKLIEACAHARPIVATPVATRGFGDSIRRRVLVSDGPEEFSKHCVRLLRDGHLADCLGSELKQIRDEKFAPEAVSMKAVDDIAAIIDATLS